MRMLRCPPGTDDDWNVWAAISCVRRFAWVVSKLSLTVSLSYKLKNQWRDGTTHILMERHELLERLAPLIPPPRAHQVCYFGILAPCASGRSQIVPGARGEAGGVASAARGGSQEAPCALDPTRTCRPPYAENGQAGEIRAPEADPSAASECGSDASQAAQADQARGSTQQAVTPRPVSSVRPRCLPWADLLQRIFGIEALRCECGHSMRVLAATATVRKRRRLRRRRH